MERRSAAVRRTPWLIGLLFSLACSDPDPSRPPVGASGSAGAPSSGGGPTGGVAASAGGSTGAGGSTPQGGSNTGGVSAGGSTPQGGSATGGAATGGAAPSAGTSGSAEGGSGDGGVSAGAPGNAGNSDEGGAGQGSGPSEEIPEGYVKAIIGVGYGGIRIVSRDAGEHWGDRQSLAPDGGDDEDLMRAVTYGKGRWIVTGWKLWSSDDGLEWADHGMLTDGIIDDEVIVEGLAYKEGYFYAAGDGNPARLYRSSDGLAWSEYAEIGDTVQHTNLAYRGGLFVSYGDSHTSYQSSDGLVWTEMDGIDDATYCENEWKTLEDCRDAAWFDDGFYLIPEWGGTIRRALDGGEFEDVYQDDQENTLYRSRAVAEGYVAPE